MGGGVVDAEGAIFKTRLDVRDADGSVGVQCWRRSARDPRPAGCIFLPWHFVFDPESPSGGGGAALCGSEGRGIDAAVRGGALEVAVQLQVAPDSWTWARVVPFLITVGGAGGVAGECVAAGLTGRVLSISLQEEKKTNKKI